MYISKHPYRSSNAKIKSEFECNSCKYELINYVLLKKSNNELSQITKIFPRSIR